MAISRANPVRGLSILFVCEGNVCRSPAAEGLLRHELGRDSLIEARSAGTNALLGTRVPEQLVVLLGEVGTPIRRHAARQVTVPMIRAAELVLVMTIQQRAELLSMDPSALKKTFRLLEFSRLLEMLGTDQPVKGESDRLRSAIPWASRHRAGLVNSLDPILDVVDPFGRDERTYEDSVGQITQAVSTICSFLSH